MRAFARYFLISLAIPILSARGVVRPSPELETSAKQLAGSIYTGPSMTTLRELTDNYGGRLSGSPAYNRAVDWAVAKFRSYAIPDVHTETFMLPNGWERGPAQGEIVSPISRVLHVQSLGWAPSTPPGGVKGEVVLIDDISANAIKAKAAQIKGKIVMLDFSKIMEEGISKAFPKLDASAELFRNAGALAVVNPSHARNQVISAFSLDWRANLSPLPEAHIGLEDSELIERKLKEGPVVVQVELQNKTSGPIMVRNVIAEIRGSEKPDEWILVGGHFDSWDFGTGAEDNGTGSVTVLESARAMAAFGKPPMRSIRFALWGGEEEGILGSYDYVQAHLKEIRKCVAVLNSDSGPGHPKGWRVEERQDVKTGLQPISDGLLKDLGGGEISLELNYDTDHGPFLLQGVPALDQWVDTTPYDELHHKPADTYDKVDPVDFKADEAIVGATAWVIANSPEPIAPHIDHTAVGELLKKTQGLTELLTSSGQWKP
jgi:carboxypeptidase Q